MAPHCSDIWYKAPRRPVPVVLTCEISTPCSLLSEPPKGTQGTLTEARSFWLVLMELYGVITLSVVLSLRGKWLTVLIRNGVFYGIVARMNRVNMNRKASPGLFFLVLCL